MDTDGLLKFRYEHSKKAFHMLGAIHHQKELVSHWACIGNTHKLLLVPLNMSVHRNFPVKLFRLESFIKGP